MTSIDAGRKQRRRRPEHRETTRRCESRSNSPDAGASLRRVVAAVLIPIKSFDLAKGRLRDAMPANERASLARSMAATVVRAANGLSVWVVCGDAEVAGFAAKRGANVIWREPRGLNIAVSEGLDLLRTEGFDRVIVSHADLPLATDLSWLADESAGSDAGGPCVVLVPDRRDDGSNVLVVPTSCDFQFAYGPGSARAHQSEARRLGLTFSTISDQRLGWDIDVPEDLAVFSGGDFFNPTLPTHGALS